MNGAADAASVTTLGRVGRTGLRQLLRIRTEVGPSQSRGSSSERRSVVDQAAQIHELIIGDQESELHVAFSRVSIHELRNHEAFQYKSVMSPLISMTSHSMDENDLENELRPPVRPRSRQPHGALAGAGAHNGCVVAQFWV